MFVLALSNTIFELKIGGKINLKISVFESFDTRLCVVLDQTYLQLTLGPLKIAK